MGGWRDMSNRQGEGKESVSCQLGRGVWGLGGSQV